MECEPKLDVYRNPLPPLTPDLIRALGSGAINMDEFGDSCHGLLLDEYICNTRLGGEAPSDLREWREISTGWIPQHVFDWWLPKFANEENLQSMPLGWWYRRARAVVAANVGEAVVAAGALTTVIGDGTQGTLTYQTKDLCYEIRATVVEEAYRGNGIFKKVVERLLAEARHRGDLPTVLVTDNEVLRNVIRRQTLTAPAVIGLDNLCQALCWCPSPRFPPCDTCPTLPGRALTWRTDLPLPLGEQDWFDYQDGPTASSVWREPHGTLANPHESA